MDDLNDENITLFRGIAFGLTTVWGIVLTYGLVLYVGCQLSDFFDFLGKD